MNEERIKVLEMLADGKITIDQANQLIEAISGAGESALGKRYEENVRDLTEVRDQNSTLTNMHITKEFTLYDLAPQDLTVAAGGRLILHGRDARDLILESGATVDFRGSVGRDLYNRSDMTVDLYGLVEGDVYNSPGSRINLYGQIQGDVYSQYEDLTVFGKLRGSLHDEIRAE
jgi:SHOCT-like protein